MSTMPQPAYFLVCIGINKSANPISNTPEIRFSSTAHVAKYGGIKGI